MFKKFYKNSDGQINKLHVFISMFVGVLTILVAWKTLELPTFATEAYIDRIDNKVDQRLSKLTIIIQGITSFQKDTRAILLNQEWWRIQVKIDNYKQKLLKDPNSAIIRDYISELSRQQQQLKQQIVKIVR